MTAEVKVLVKGFTSADSIKETNEEKTRATITLVRDGDIVMVVDPGVLESQDILANELAKENLDIEDVNFVCITHSHIDHYRNIGMFKNAKVLEYYGVWDNEFVEDWQQKFSENIQVLRTPGHDYTDITLFVKTEKGIVAICGDVFWKENYPENPQDDQFASDPARLRQSRQMILKMADWIVPGHGDIYKNKHTQEDAQKILAQEAKNQAKIFAICRKCKKPILKKLDSCRCRPWLCHNCCECGLDCDLCGCSHKTNKWKI